MKSLMEYIAVPLFLLFVLAVIMVGTVAVDERVKYTSAVPMIEHLRKDIRVVAPSRAEDVYGQATQWNQTIAKKQAWNQVPFVCLLIPNGWDMVQPIEVGFNEHP